MRSWVLLLLDEPRNRPREGSPELARAGCDTRGPGPRFGDLVKSKLSG